MVQRIGGAGSSGIPASGGQSPRRPIVTSNYTYDKLSPPEEVVWLRIPNFQKLKSLFKNGRLILPSFYRPGMYLNVIV